MTARLHHEITGPAGAPVVVLASSIGTTAALWDPQVGGLADQFRVLRYDHRGHGRSEVPPGPYAIAELGADVVALLDQLDLERVSFCGLSLGGMVGMWLATHAPERIDRLALACTAPQLGPPEMWADRAATVRAEGTAALVEPVLQRWFTADFVERHPVTVERVAAMLRATPAEGYAACCDAIRVMDQRADLPSITAPTLVLAGADDPSTPPAVAQSISAAIPGSTLVVLPGAAHLANIAQPELFGAALRAHLTGDDG